MTPAEIKQARQTLGLTQDQMATMLDYSGKSQVSKIERGADNASGAVQRLIRLYVTLHREAPHLLPDDWPGSNAKKAV